MQPKSHSPTIRPMVPAGSIGIIKPTICPRRHKRKPPLSFCTLLFLP